MEGRGLGEGYGGVRNDQDWDGGDDGGIRVRTRALTMDSGLMV